MIIAIADDFSGAAEMAGIGNAYGLDTLLLTSMTHYAPCDLLVLDSNTRSFSEADAVSVLRNITEDIREKIHSGEIPPGTMLFKKVDSVLRGHLLAETEVLMSVFGYRLVLIAPANPEKGRKIIKGKYFIHGQAIHQTSFVDDPEYPRLTSDVKQLLGGHKLNGNYKHLFTHEALTGQSGYLTIDIQDTNDLWFYVNQVNHEILLAGAAESFEVLLQSKGLERKNQQALDTIRGKHLFVRGSTFNPEEEKEFFRKQQAKYLVPAENGFVKSTGQWAKEIGKLLSVHDSVVMSISTNSLLSHTPHLYSESMAATVRYVVEQVGLENLNLIISGGSTASAILQELGLECFVVVRELEPGVVALKPCGMESILIVKPGSYTYPESLRQLLSLNSLIKCQYGL